MTTGLYPAHPLHFDALKTIKVSYGGLHYMKGIKVSYHHKLDHIKTSVHQVFFDAHYVKFKVVGLTLGKRQGYTLDRSPVHHGATQRLTGRVSLESPINLLCVFLNCASPHSESVPGSIPTCSPCVCLGSLQVFRLPPTVQKHVC